MFPLPSGLPPFQPGDLGEELGLPSVGGGAKLGLTRLGVATKGRLALDVGEHQVAVSIDEAQRGAELGFFADDEGTAERAARSALLGDDALDERALGAIPRAQPATRLASGAKDDELARLEGVVATELLAKRELLLRVARAQDLDAQLGDAELPGLPRLDEVMRDAELDERVGSEAPAGVFAIVVDEVVLSDRAALTDGGTKDELQELAELTVAA